MLGHKQTLTEENMKTSVLEEVETSDLGVVEVVAPNMDLALKPAPRHKFKAQKDTSKGNYDKATGRKFAKAVPEHLKFYRLPENLNKFIEEIYPNMQVLVSSRAISAGDSSYVADVISEFMVYMLTYSAKKKRFRWQIYDSVQFSTLPYYRWWLNNLQFFCLRRKTDYETRKERDVTISHTVEESEEVGGISAPSLAAPTPECCSDDEMFMRGLMELVTCRGEEFKKRKGRCAESFAPKVLALRLEGYDAEEISKKTRLSLTKVTNILTYLEDMVKFYCKEIREEEISIHPW